MTNTLINPGAFQKRKKGNLRRFFSSIYGRIRDGRWTSIYYYVIAETNNIWNERLASVIKYHCPNCDFNTPYFINLSNNYKISWKSVCPNCNSRPRHRGLKFLYDELLSGLGEIQVLHFAPEPILMHELRKNINLVYQTTDYLLGDVDYPGEDIQNLNFQDNEFDVILCNHVIEHVPDDLKALEEIKRILKPDGFAIITIPGDWSRNETIVFPDLRNNGHYRDYGLSVEKLMQSVFSHVEVRDLQDYDLDRKTGLRNGIPTSEPAFVCYK